MFPDISAVLGRIQSVLLKESLVTFRFVFYIGNQNIHQWEYFFVCRGYAVKQKNYLRVLPFILQCIFGTEPRAVKPYGLIPVFPVHPFQLGRNH